MQIASISRTSSKMDLERGLLKFIEAVFILYQSALSAMVKEKVVEINAHFIWFSHVYLDLNICIVVYARACEQKLFPPNFIQLHYKNRTQSGKETRLLVFIAIIKHHRCGIIHT